ncbi:MAG: hypothetical protein SPF07_04090 [Eubacteriales bacterium]|nr:hypothetical protein [Eubacteriales bacterium]
MEKFKALNELNIKITNNDKTLVDENCCTAITISLNNEGNVFTSFVGAYNPAIIKLLQKVQRRYYRNLIKKLKANNQEVVDNITKNADVAEDETPVEEKKIKTKKVHENSRVKKDVVDDKSNINKEDKKD